MEAHLRLFRSCVMTSAVAVLLGMAPAYGAWKMAPGSSVGYVSIKNNGIAENNRFTDVSGAISDSGELTVKIALASVETGVQIRNERMQTLFFDVSEYPAAVLTGQLEASDLSALADGFVVDTTVALTLSLHGVSGSVPVRVRAVVNGDRLYVSSLEPALVAAADFDLADGVVALQQIAGLKAISQSVPVTVDLQFLWQQD